MRKGITYYPWYKNISSPIVGGGFWGSGSTNQPVLGNYNSNDCKVIQEHIKWIKNAGFDFIYINLTSIDGPDLSTITEKLIPQIILQNLNFAFFIDSYQAINKLNKVDFMQMDKIYDSNITRSQRFLNVLFWIENISKNYKNYEFIDGKPLIFIYIARNFQWIDYNNFEIVKKELLKFYTVADMIDWSPFKWKINKLLFNYKNKIKIDIINIVKIIFNKIYKKKKIFKFELNDFDLISWYNLAQPFVSNNLDKNITELIESVKINKNKIAFTIIPGYDDSKLSLNDNILKIDRLNGDLLDKFYKNLSNYNNILYTFVSFNEWHEGTEIEPSLEYGDFYLNLVRNYNNKLND